MNRYTNRELSWLQFNERVLYEAADPMLSVADRLKFISIFNSNLDEFFMVRVGSLYDQRFAGYDKLDLADMTVQEQLDAIRKESKRLQDKQRELYYEVLDDASELGLEITNYNQLNQQEKRDLSSYFAQEIYPVLTPLGIDSHRTFPLIQNKSTYLAVELQDKDKKLLSLIQIPSILPTLVEVKRDTVTAKYIYLEDLITNNLSMLFTGYSIRSVSIFRITRNADLSVNEEDAEDLLLVIEDSIKQRKWGEVVRMEVAHGSNKAVIKNLMKSLHVSSDEMHYADIPLDLTFCIGVDGPKGSRHFKGSTQTPKKVATLERRDIFQAVREEDQFFHVPYDSFSHIEHIITKAAKDDQVLAIKMTLYRVNGGSAIVKALKEAALKGKQVTVLVELLARFDEEQNIEWARQLEQSGANVIYGVFNLKTHSKIFMIVRREDQGIKRYVHLGTGNYNSNTAKLYTDMSILTAREDLGADASTFFNLISGYSKNPLMNRLIYAPERLRDHIELLMDQEIKKAKEGLEARIDIKVNSLIDKKMIDKLYEASQAGVRIRLIVRGICGLIPGVKGMSENIEVHSIVGEFLEHERIYYFKNAEPDNLFLSSADLMTRNLDRRIELLFPIIDEDIKKRILLTFELLWLDNKKSWKQHADSKYKKQDNGLRPILAHDILKHLSYKGIHDFNKQIETIISHART